MAKALTIQWSERSAQDLQNIFDFYFHKSPAAAITVVNEIIEQAESIGFTDQYQKDEIVAKYRRMVVRHFKILYRAQKNTIYILRIFDTRQDPAKQELH